MASIETVPDGELDPFERELPDDCEFFEPTTDLAARTNRIFEQEGRASLDRPAAASVRPSMTFLRPCSSVWPLQ